MRNESALSADRAVIESSHGHASQMDGESNRGNGGAAADMKKGQSNILVAVRLRPMLSKELSDGHFNLVKILDDNVVVL